MKSAIQELNVSIMDAIRGTYGESTEVTIFGLAEPVLVRDSESEATSPAIVNAKGECMIVYDGLDRADLTMYSRLQSISYEDDSTSAYGNKHGYKQSADVSLVVLGKRSLDAFKLEMIISDVIASGKERILNGAEFNAVQVWSGEFPGVPYFINPDYFIFKINFHINKSTMRCS